MNLLEYMSNNIIYEFRLYLINIKRLSDLNQGIHGINHLLRVLLFALLICESLKISSHHRNIVSIAALYHDIGRKNDDADLTHGLLSWRKAQKYISEDFSKNDLNIIKYIIENHCIPDEVALDNVKAYNISNKFEAQILLNIVKDADSLDIMRLGVFEEKYLRYEASIKLIPIARYINSLNDEVQNL